MPTETDHHSKTETATPRKREESRRKGQFAVSSELSTGAVMLVGVGVLWLTGQQFTLGLTETMRRSLLSAVSSQWGPEHTTALAWSLWWHLGALTGMLLGAIFVTGLVVGGLQTGFGISGHPLSPDWSRLSPMKGLKRIFSQRALMRGVTTVAKLAAIAVLVAVILVGRVGELGLTSHGTLAQAAAAAWELALLLAVAIAAALLLIGLADFLFQRWKHEQDLRMSRREVLDERKQEEGDPHMRARLRKLQREMGQRQMLSDVPTASVVITNPTHFAVAIRYDRQTMAAPQVVAKGSDLWARRIIQIAREHDVPVLERKPLARALYAAVEVGQEIPVDFYQAVAEILAYLFRIKRLS